MYLIDLYKKMYLGSFYTPWIRLLFLLPLEKEKKVDLEYLFLEIYHFFNHNSIFILWLTYILEVIYTSRNPLIYNWCLQQFFN